MSRRRSPSPFLGVAPATPKASRPFDNDRRKRRRRKAPPTNASITRSLAPTPRNAPHHANGAPCHENGAPRRHRTKDTVRETMAPAGSGSHRRAQTQQRQIMGRRPRWWRMSPRRHRCRTLVSDGFSFRPPTWSRFMDRVMQGLRNIFVYLDDILVASENETNHEANEARFSNDSPSTVLSSRRPSVSSASTPLTSSVIKWIDTAPSRSQRRSALSESYWRRKRPTNFVGSSGC